MRQLNVGLSWAIGMVFILLINDFPSAFAAEPATQVSISADRLQLQGNRKQAVFNGNVRFEVGNTRFSCDRMVVQYDQTGAIGSATASGHIVITRDDARAEADEATLNLKTGVVILRGQPRFTKDRNTLMGRVIQINIHTGEVNVTEASGTFIFPQTSAQ
ncbi:MAG: hypothetical protein JXX14_08020 [Deltaproteobacteria bacterium]|nr:hypothetical protein [Deltaproteobacteria bacterium]